MFCTILKEVGFVKPNEIAYHISLKSVNKGLMLKTTWEHIISHIYIDYRIHFNPCCNKSWMSFYTCFAPFSRKLDLKKTTIELTYYHINAKYVSECLMLKTTWGHIISHIYSDYRNLVKQGSHRLEKYLNIQDCLEQSLKIKFALKSTWKTL